ncbi:MAG: hypothetical protein WBA13_17675 [Microcoleaceae cyanobacterium]
MNPDSSFTAAERLESLKAGVIAALGTGLTFVMLYFIHRLIAQPLATSLVQLAIQTAIALLSGFLFGVTYRYVIRTDKNLQLNTGAVFAFGLIRGLATVEDQLLNLSVWVNTAFAIAENIILFAVAAIVLNIAFQQGWIKPFPNS